MDSTEQETLINVLNDHRLSYFQTVAGVGSSGYRCSCGVASSPSHHPQHLALKIAEALRDASEMDEYERAVSLAAEEADERTEDDPGPPRPGVWHRHFVAVLREQGYLIVPADRC